MQEQRGTNKIFTENYAFDYELVSAMHPRTWEIGSRRLVELLPPQDGDTILEVGSGTGNSTIEILNANPHVERLFATEYSKGFAQLSWYKFGLLDLDLPSDLDEGARDYIQEGREKAASIGANVDFGLARAEALPIKSDSVDKIYMSQVIHWLAFADDDVAGENINHLDKSIAEFNRVLRRGGQIVFDTSGHQTDLADHELNGVRLKDTHVLSHPFYRAFVARFNGLMEENGFSFRVSPDKLGKYHNIFNTELLLRKFASFGFEPQNIDGKKCGFTVIPLNLERFLANIRNEERMKILTLPGLEILGESEKERLFNETLIGTLADHQDLTEIPVNEIRINFLFKKIA